MARGSTPPSAASRASTRSSSRCRRTGSRQRRTRADGGAVPQGYEPGYPTELSPEEYRELIAAGVHLRAARLALATGALAGCSADAQDAEPAPREQQVLALVRELHATGATSWYPRTSFQTAGTAVVLSIPISFGNSHNGVFDAGRARELGRRLFESYGLTQLEGLPARTGPCIPARADSVLAFPLHGRHP